MNYFLKNINGDYCIYQGGELALRFKHEEIAKIVLALLKRDEKTA